MSLVTIKEHKGNMVLIGFFSRSDVDREYKAYQELVKGKLLKRKEVEVLPLGSDMLLMFRTEEEAKAWRKRHTMRQKAYNDQERICALTKLAEAYGPDVQVGEYKPGRKG